MKKIDRLKVINVLIQCFNNKYYDEFLLLTEVLEYLRNNKDSLENNINAQIETNYITLKFLGNELSFFKSGLMYNEDTIYIKLGDKSKFIKNCGYNIPFKKAKELIKC